MTKNIDWRGSSLKDLRNFPVDVKKRAGYELEQIQQGLPPTQWKSVNDWGPAWLKSKLMPLTAHLGLFISQYLKMQFTSFIALRKRLSKPV
ncbi:hypothetical protein [Rahnella variigena]|uniref:hypothetical protein n=1 Tax=Rahnella variigena TaxID=574964 RepID=UPI003C7CCF71